MGDVARPIAEIVPDSKTDGLVVGAQPFVGELTAEYARVANVVLDIDATTGKVATVVPPSEEVKRLADQARLSDDVAAIATGPDGVAGDMKDSTAAEARARYIDGLKAAGGATTAVGALEWAALQPKTDTATTQHVVRNIYQLSDVIRVAKIGHDRDIVLSFSVTEGDPDHEGPETVTPRAGMVLSLADALRWAWIPIHRASGVSFEDAKVRVKSIDAKNVEDTLLKGANQTGILPITSARHPYGLDQSMLWTGEYAADKARAKLYEARYPEICEVLVKGTDMTFTPAERVEYDTLKARLRAFETSDPLIRKEHSIETAMKAIKSNLEKLEVKARTTTARDRAAIKQDAVAPPLKTNYFLDSMGKAVYNEAAKLAVQDESSDDESRSRAEFSAATKIRSGDACCATDPPLSIFRSDFMLSPQVNLDALVDAAKWSLVEWERELYIEFKRFEEQHAHLPEEGKGGKIALYALIGKTFDDRVPGVWMQSPEKADKWATVSFGTNANVTETDLKAVELHRMRKRELAQAEAAAKETKSSRSGDEDTPEVVRARESLEIATSAVKAIQEKRAVLARESGSKSLRPDPIALVVFWRAWHVIRTTTAKMSDKKLEDVIADNMYKEIGYMRTERKQIYAIINTLAQIAICNGEVVSLSELKLKLLPELPAVRTPTTKNGWPTGTRGRFKADMRIKVSVLNPEVSQGVLMAEQYREAVELLLMESGQNHVRWGCISPPVLAFARQMITDRRPGTHLSDEDAKKLSVAIEEYTTAISEEMKRMREIRRKAYAETTATASVSSGSAGSIGLELDSRLGNPSAASASASSNPTAPKS